MVDHQVKQPQKHCLIQFLFPHLPDPKFLCFRVKLYHLKIHLNKQKKILQIEITIINHQAKFPTAFRPK